MAETGYDTTQMKVAEIREVLIDKFDYDAEDIANVKGKAALVGLLNDELDGEKVDSDIDFGDGEDSGDFEPTDDTDEEVKAKPIIGDIEWHDYVMEQFADDELIKGNPTVDGMRRLVERMVARIRKIDTHVVASPEQITPEGARNDRRATVVVTVELEDETSFDGAGDVYWGNTDKPYGNYAVSVAETRAEGRALKRALRLRKVNAAEEIAEKIEHDLTPTDPANEENVEEGFITPTQLRFLDVMCGSDRMNINVKELIKHMGMTYSIKSLTHKDALSLNEQLSKYQTNDEEIPSELKGYDATWRN